MSVFSVNKTDLLTKVLDRYGVQPRPRMGWQPIRCINAAAHSHGDRNPSASVHLAYGRYTCHACGLHGDGFQLMLDLEQMNAKDVLKEFSVIADDKEEPTWIL